MSPEYRDYLLDLLAPLGVISARTMFGGGGLYLDGTMFAIVADDTLYLKADDENRADFGDHGMGPFTYTRDGRAEPIAMSYWEAPTDALDDGDELCRLAGRAFDAARRAEKTKNKGRKKA